MKEPTLYKLIRPILTFLFKIFFHPHINGKENIKKGGRIILAGNHTNILDCVLLLSSTKRVIHFLAKDELTKGPLRFIFNGLGIIPVNRKDKDSNALQMAISFLEKDKLIGIFPEGTINRTKDSTIPFKSGSIRMALETDSEIIPFSITGKYNVFGKGVSITFEKPYKIEHGEIKVQNEILRNKINTMIEERR